MKLLNLKPLKSVFILKCCRSIFTQECSFIEFGTLVVFIVNGSGRV